MKRGAPASAKGQSGCKMGCDLQRYEKKSGRSVGGSCSFDRVDMELAIYETMTPQYGRSVVQVVFVRVDIGVVIYKAMTPQCGRSVFQVLVVRVDIGNPSVGGQWLRLWLSEWI